MDLINLTTADLTANKQGLLSERQRQCIRQQRLVWAAGSMGLGGLVVLVTAVLFWKLRHPLFADRGQLTLALPIILFWFWLLRHTPQQWLRANRDLRQGRVSVVEGTLQTTFTLGIGIFRIITHRIYLNPLTFRVSETVFQQCKSGEVYRIYYASHSRQFLGALPLVTETAPIVNQEMVLLEPLTTREEEILQLIAAGLSNQEIAAQLSLSVNTVKMYASQLYQKLGVRRRTEAIARARKLHLLQK